MDPRIDGRQTFKLVSIWPRVRLPFGDGSPRDSKVVAGEIDDCEIVDWMRESEGVVVGWYWSRHREGDECGDREEDLELHFGGLRVLGSWGV